MMPIYKHLAIFLLVILGVGLLSAVIYYITVNILKVMRLDLDRKESVIEAVENDRSYTDDQLATGDEG